MVRVRRRAPIVVLVVDIVQVKGTRTILDVDYCRRKDVDLYSLGAVFFFGVDQGAVEDWVGFKQEDF